MVLLEFDNVPKIHDLVYRLIRNMIDNKLMKPCKILDMKGLHTSRVLGCQQMEVMNNNSLLCLKATIVMRLASCENLIIRFISNHRRLINDLLKFTFQRQPIDENHTNNYSQNSDKSQIPRKEKVSMETVRIVCYALTMLNSINPTVCEKLKRSKSTLLRLKAIFKSNRGCGTANGVALLVSTMFEDEKKNSRLVKAFLNQLLQKCAASLAHDDGQELIISLIVLSNICKSKPA